MTEYSPAKTVEYPRIFPNFQNCTRHEKDLKDNRDNSRHLGRKYARLFVLGHYLFLPVRFSEQIMSADKYPSIFSRQMVTIVYLYNNQINARALIGQSAGVIVPVNPRKNRASSELLYKSNTPQVFYGL